MKVVITDEEGMYYSVIPYDDEAYMGTPSEVDDETLKRWDHIQALYDGMQEEMCKVYHLPHESVSFRSSDHVPLVENKPDP